MLTTIGHHRSRVMTPKQFTLLERRVTALEAKVEKLSKPKPKPKLKAKAKKK